MKLEVASIYPGIETFDATSRVVLRSHFWLYKASKPEGRIVGTRDYSFATLQSSTTVRLTNRWRPAVLRLKI